MTATTDTPICRVCRSEGTPEQPLFYPCLCSGSIKYIHQDCLTEWLNHSKKTYCELCKHPFTFSPIYAPQMPNRMPLSVMLLGILRFAGRFLRRGLMLLFAVFLWGFLVPVLSANIFRYYFGFSLQGLLQISPLRLTLDFDSQAELQQFVFESSIYLLFDVVQGLLICGFTVFLALGMLLTRELQTMLRPAPEPRPNANTPDSDEEVEVNRSESVRSRRAENIASETTPLLNQSTPQPPATPQRMQSPRHPTVFSPQTEQLFSEIARLEEAMNGSPQENATGSGYWLDRVHPKEYKKYVQRSNLQRQLMATERQGTTGAAEPLSPLADESFSHLNFDDHLSNISGTTTLRTTATSRGIDSIRCRICSSNTCVNRDHVIQASRMRFASVAARNQALIDEALEFGDMRPAAANAINNVGQPPVTPTPARPAPAPPAPQQQPQQPEEDWGLNLDADAITLPEFFGFGANGSNPFELIQNASIVVGCNTVVMLLLLFLPSFFGSHVLKNWQVIPSATTGYGFAARLVVGYAVLALTLGFYHSFGKRFFRDPFHKAFLPVLGFFGTFWKLITLLGTEMIIFPIACGFAIDFLCLPLLPGSSMSGRIKHFQALPITSSAIHWALGAAFMLSFASHITFLRAFLRPGLLFFLRNPADPEAHPLREMLERSFLDQCYRLVVSFVFYSMLITGSLGGAVVIIKNLLSNLPPLRLSFSEPLAEAPIGLLLHLSLRWFVSALRPGMVLGKAYKSLASIVLQKLDLESYFLARHPATLPASGSLAAVPDFDRIYSRKNLKAIRAYRPTGFNDSGKPAQSTIVYRPSFFALRCLLVIIVAFAVAQFSCVSLYALPLSLGRKIIPTALDNELVTWFVGALPLVLLLGLLGGGSDRAKSFLSGQAVQKAAYLTISFVFIGLAWPLMLGSLLALITSPLLQADSLFNDALTIASNPVARFLLNLHADHEMSQSLSIVFFTSCWSIGFPLLRLAHTLRAHLPLPQRTLAALNTLHERSIRKLVLDVVIPVTALLSACLVLPPLIPLVMVPLITDLPIDYVYTAQRVSHFSLLLVFAAWKLGTAIGRALGGAIRSIRDDAYLVGRQLHNLERTEAEESTPRSSTVRERRIPTTPIL